jgi:hypothetical protein
MALVNAVALPGGYTHRSVPSKITVKRRLHLGRRARPVVLPGEIITVPEPFIWPGARASVSRPRLQQARRVCFSVVTRPGRARLRVTGTAGTIHT